MSAINYSEKIPNNVDLGGDRTLQRILRDLALEAAAAASVFKPNLGD
jgi:hypothetical protein